MGHCFLSTGRSRHVIAVPTGSVSQEDGAKGIQITVLRDYHDIVVN